MIKALPSQTHAIVVSLNMVQLCCIQLRAVLRKNLILVKRQVSTDPCEVPVLLPLSLLKLCVCASSQGLAFMPKDVGVDNGVRATGSVGNAKGNRSTVFASVNRRKGVPAQGSSACATLASTLEYPRVQSAPGFQESEGSVSCDGVFY